MNATHYDLLGVDIDATAEQIEAAFQRIAAAGNGRKDADHARFMMEITMARDVLCNAMARNAYDDASGVSAIRRAAREKIARATPSFFGADRQVHYKRMFLRALPFQTCGRACALDKSTKVYFTDVYQQYFRNYFRLPMLGAFVLYWIYSLLAGPGFTVLTVTLLYTLFRFVGPLCLGLFYEIFRPKDRYCYVNRVIFTNSVFVEMGWFSAYVWDLSAAREVEIDYKVPDTLYRWVRYLVFNLHVSYPHEEIVSRMRYTIIGESGGDSEDAGESALMRHGEAKSRLDQWHLAGQRHRADGMLRALQGGMPIWDMRGYVSALTPRMRTIVRWGAPVAIAAAALGMASSALGPQIPYRYHLFAAPARVIGPYADIAYKPMPFADHLVTPYRFESDWPIRIYAYVVGPGWFVHGRRCFFYDVKPGQPLGLLGDPSAANRFAYAFMGPQDEHDLHFLYVNDDFRVVPQPPYERTNGVLFRITHRIPPEAHGKPQAEDWTCPRAD